MTTTSFVSTVCGQHSDAML